MTKRKTVDPERIGALLAAADHAGDAQRAAAQHTLGTAFYFGYLGLDHSPEKAVEQWRRSAAEAGLTPLHYPAAPPSMFASRRHVPPTSNLPQRRRR
jgi:hypothetical protein